MSSTLEDDLHLSSDSESSDSSAGLEEGVFLVENVLDFRAKKDARGKFICYEYLVKWKHYGEADNTWEPEENMGANKILRKFWADRGGKPKENDSRIKQRKSATKKPENKGLANRMLYTADSDSDSETTSSAAVKKKKSDKVASSGSKVKESGKTKDPQPPKSDKRLTDGSVIGRKKSRLASETVLDGADAHSLFRPDNLEIANSKAPSTSTKGVAVDSPKAASTSTTTKGVEISNKKAASTSTKGGNSRLDSQRTSSSLSSNTGSAHSDAKETSSSVSSASVARKVDFASSSLRLSLDNGLSPSPTFGDRWSPECLPIPDHIRESFNDDNDLIKDPERRGFVFGALKRLMRFGSQVMDGMGQFYDLKVIKSAEAPLPIEEQNFESCTAIQYAGEKYSLPGEIQTCTNIENERIFNLSASSLAAKFGAAVKLNHVNYLMDVRRSLPPGFDVEQADPKTNSISLLTLISLRKCDQEDAGLHPICTMASILLEMGADPNRPTHVWSFTPLMTASHLGRCCFVAELLTHGANPNFVNLKGETALTIACREDQLEVAKLLIVSGADLTFKDSSALTPLEIARMYGAKSICEAIEKFQVKCATVMSKAVRTVVSGQAKLREPLSAVRYVSVGLNKDSLAVTFKQNRNLTTSKGEGMVLFIAKGKVAMRVDGDTSLDGMIDCAMEPLNFIRSVKLNGGTLKSLSRFEGGSDDLSVCIIEQWPVGLNTLLLELKAECFKKGMRIPLLIQPWLVSVEGVSKLNYDMVVPKKRPAVH